MPLTRLRDEASNKTINNFDQSSLPTFLNKLPKQVMAKSQKYEITGLNCT